MDKSIYDLIGIGVGPFNLSLAALLDPVDSVNVKFFDDKPFFKWHPELMFNDAKMQTSFLKDLVTPVDPKSAYSFLNYLVEHGQFYQFLNTSRSTMTRFEFEAYCRWVSEKLSHSIEFDSRIENVEFTGNSFLIRSRGNESLAKNICIASGPVKNIPECTKPHLGQNIFHAKSKEMLDLSVKDKRVLIVGGGQTGVEMFRNCLKGQWGNAQEVTLITGRENLQPLDEGPFTNEVFTPNFVSNFHSLTQDKKDSFTSSLLLTSDGNTPEYLQELYTELYLDKFYQNKFPKNRISPMRWLVDMNVSNNSINAIVQNKLNETCEVIEADIVILATGFKTQLPSFLRDIKEFISFDAVGRPIFKKDYRLATSLENNQIYAMNYSRHGHGIADPQTSLMSWRSSVIVNSLLGKNFYKNTENNNSFINFFNNEAHL